MDRDRTVEEPLLDRPTPPRRRRRRWPWVVLATLAALGAAGGAWWWTREGATPLSLPGLGAITAERATLYFADPRWTRLVPEERRLSPSADPVAHVRTLVTALAEGPRGEAAPVLPRELKVRGVYLGRDGLAVLDLDDPAGFDPGGVAGEALAVFAVVHTLVANVPGLASVQFLLDGQVRDTLAGHVKISEPLRPDPQWLVTEPGP